MSEEEIRKDLETAVEVVRKGGIILYPTDTVWGIGCDATNSEAVARLFALKRRPGAKTMISLVDSVASLKKWIPDIPGEALAELENPSRPVTIVFDHPVGIVSSLIAEDDSSAFRIPRNDFTNTICKELGKPLVSTSANFSGDSTPLSFEEISEDLKGMVDYVCFYGRESVSRVPSRILKITPDGKKKIIRE